ncbi:MAG: metallophosphoesterase [Thermoanaerobaculales bacterium]|nr:metallophosphoesterase [Thermoanaerobaculales bacterium]
MTCPCLFVSDLHGSRSRYRTLWEVAAAERPAAVLLGGDLLSNSVGMGGANTFVREVFEAEVEELRDRLGSSFPKILLIPGNDDAAVDFASFEAGETRGLWQLIHRRRVAVGEHDLYGYGCVPPTPFLLKDWECYDVSRFTDPGCLSPEEGHRTAAVDPDEIRYGTIAGALETMAGEKDQNSAVWLFHSPPYRTALDRAALDGQSYEHVPLDVNIGSIAVRRFVEERQPLLTLHGHVHESARLTQKWREQLGRTWIVSAAHDGPELALVRIDLDDPANVTRELL